MPAWPQSLPDCPVNRSFSWTVVANIVETPNDVGDVISRRRFTGTTILESGTLALTRAQTATLLSFWANDCAQGSLEFMMPSWRDGELRDYKFVGSQPPQFTAVATMFQCSLSFKYTILP